MKSKLAKRLSAVILSLAMCVGLLDTSSLAATFNSATEIKPVNGTGNDGKIVVTVYDQDPGSTGSGAQISSGMNNPVNGVGINALRIGSVVELTSTDNDVVSTQVAFGLTETYADLLGLETTMAIASQIDSGNGTTTYYFEPTVVQKTLGSATQTNIEDYLDDTQNGATKKVTGTAPDTNGVATFDNLPYGLYLLAKSALPAEATTDLVPFLVSVPMYVDNAWESTVYAYPKVRTGDITISKTVDDQDDKEYTNDNDKYVNAGQTLTYTVTTTIPASQSADGTGSANKFTSFVITDTNTNKTLDIDLSTLTVNSNWTGTDKETYDDSPNQGQYDYYYTYSDTTDSTTNRALVITLTDTGLQKLNNGLSTAQNITVTYNATVDTDVNFSSKLTNTAKATYHREGMTGTADATVVDGQTDTVDLYTYGIDLTKTLSSGTITNDRISFALYTDEACTDENKIPVISGTGGYWVAATEETTPVVMYVGIDGKLNLYGLEPDIYYLKETATMDGYTLLDKPITIVITDEDSDGTATATVNGATAQVTNGVVSLSVENTKNETGFTLPQTGGAGTLMVTALGLGLLCVGVILLVVYRRKGQKNS